HPSSGMPRRIRHAQGYLARGRITRAPRAVRQILCLPRGTIKTAAAACRLKEGEERRVDLLGEAVVESARIMVLPLVLVVRENEFAADLPDVRLEGVLQAVFLHLIEHLDLTRVRLEVGPNVV